MDKFNEGRRLESPKILDYKNLADIWIETDDLRGVMAPDTFTAYRYKTGSPFFPPAKPIFLSLLLAANLLYSKHPSHIVISLNATICSPY
jgi:hypothetical protein